MRDFVVLVALGLCWCSCTPGEGPAPPPPSSTTTLQTTSAPAEPPDFIPSDYITRTRAGNCVADPTSRANTGLCGDLFHEIQENASRGWRDLLVLAERCPWSLEPHAGAVFPINLDAVEAKAELGSILDSQGWGFMVRLGEENRRCSEQPPFCGRTNVRKDRFSNDEGTGYRDKLRAHLEWAESLRLSLEGQPGFGVRFDSVRGWCNEQ